MSRIFLSHSSENNAQALALKRWLEQEGWDDVFLDLDPERGIKAGERWEDALRDAADRCEAVLFLISRAWLSSEWCRDEFRLARHLRKRLFGVLVEDIPVADLPATMTREWQVTNIAPAGDAKVFSVTLPRDAQSVDVEFAADGLNRLKLGLLSAGIDASFFAWPPENDPKRPPYRGLLPLEAEDAGIFFGRDGPIIEALDALRGLRESAPPRLLVILGASGAGKSSFLRAGLFPRLRRDDRNFLPLPVMRPERAAIKGDTGLLSILERAHDAAGIPATRAKIRAAVDAGAGELARLLQALLDKMMPSAPDAENKPKPPTLILSIDQAEELFRAEGREEAQHLLTLLCDLLRGEAPALILLLTIRSDAYGQLQEEQTLDGIAKIPFDLSPMPKGAYVEVIRGPAQRLAGTKRALKIDDALSDVLLADIEAGGAKDALPLLAFTMERLYVEYGGDGDLTLAEYRSLGGIKGSIQAAVERALQAADADPAIPRERAARLALLRRGLIPWLAGIEPDSGAPRRRVARLSEIPAETRPLIRHLIEQRLLATDVNKETGEAIIEPAHEALLRQWGLLEGWLAEDAGLLAVLEGIRRASRDWAANNRARAWLAHQTDRLAAANRLSARPDLAGSLEPTDRAYIAACRKAEMQSRRGKRLMQGAVFGSLIAVITGLIGWINQSYLLEQLNWYVTMRPYAAKNFKPYILAAEAERSLMPLAHFRECAADCPEMVVIPAGSFIMGSSASEQSSYKPPADVRANDLQNHEADASRNEGPQHKVVIAKSFAVSKFDVTFAELDACSSVGGCIKTSDGGMGRGAKPAINVSWDNAQQYAAWLSRMTGQPYRLLTEAEWEYAARAGSTTSYYWGEEIGKGHANCTGCGSDWNKTSPVGTFPANQFGLFDMAGNVWQWVQDCYHNNYNGAPADGSAWEDKTCTVRIARGGAWNLEPWYARSAVRFRYSAGYRALNRGFRVARTLKQ